jgi:hypothetical protein
LRYPDATDPADVPTDMSELATDVETVLFGIAGTSRYRGRLTPAAFAALTGLTDGDVVDLIANDPAGVIWRFRYNAGSASAFKWEFAGGAAASSEVGPSQNIGAGAYGDLGTVGPQFTLPRAGDYEVDFGARVLPPASAFRGWIALKRGAAATADADGASWGGPAGAGGSDVSVSRCLFALGAAAGDVYKLQYKSDVGVTSFDKRWLKIRPIRIS